MRVAIYSRVSTNGKGQDTENQARLLRQYCADNKFEIVAEITEHVSGGKKTEDREGLKELFGLCHRKKIDLVLFFALDRLSRRGVRDTLDILHYFDSNNIKWHSYSESYLSTVNTGIFTDALISILASLAQQEKKRISERVTAARAKKKEQGVRLGRPQTVEADKVLALREQGLSLAAIAEKLKISKSRVFQICKAA